MLSGCCKAGLKEGKCVLGVVRLLHPGSGAIQAQMCIRAHRLEQRNRLRGKGSLAERDRDASIISDKGLLILPEGTEMDLLTSPNPFHSREPLEKLILILPKTLNKGSAPWGIPTDASAINRAAHAEALGYQKAAPMQQNQHAHLKQHNKTHPEVTTHLPQPRPCSINLKNPFERMTVKNQQGPGTCR